MPIFVLGGYDDYSIAPRYKNYPREFIEQWNAVAPHAPFSFTLPSKYLDALLPLVHSDKVQLPTVKGGTRMVMDNAMWTDTPRAKTHVPPHGARVAGSGSRFGRRQPPVVVSSILPRHSTIPG